ncbi:DUF3360 family protein [Vibrio penaeicida]|uniref:Uncharacterized protein n=1 Tax=Vibrio penaeicida TaxID=104609 RepID=A0AAV5NQR6_9VIBR|nr:DUF3360 family protein [Vibrio penaeicida]RTZ24704.1 DUF3360 family protein [Vibrio penaeicida]GLQ72785.1 hypothetical protein GCM10007932_21450 [Vibrio penaeicida]
MKFLLLCKCTLRHYRSPSNTVILDNTGIIGNKERSDSLSGIDRFGIPLLAVSVCVGALALVGQLPGIPALL